MSILHPIEYMIAALRGQRVMFDFDLAVLYGVEVKRLNEAVRRHLDRFPADFMFQLSPDEWAELGAQENDEIRLRSQSATSKEAKSPPSATSNAKIGRPRRRFRGGRRYPPMAFAQEGVAMLSSILNSKRAVEVNVEIMRAFVRMRRDVLSYADLTHRLDELESRYDERFAVVFEALRDLMSGPPPKDRKIGFRIKASRKKYMA